MKYLGLSISCDRGKLLKDAKASIKRFVGYIKGKIQTKDKELQQLIHGAFYRSVLIYYFTPLLGAGIVSKP